MSRFTLFLITTIFFVPMVHAVGTQEALSQGLVRESVKNKLYTILAPTTPKKMVLRVGLGLLSLGVCHVARTRWQRYLKEQKDRMYVLALRKEGKEALSKGRRYIPFGENVGLNNNQIVIETNNKFAFKEKIALRKEQILGRPLLLLKENKVSQWDHRHASIMYSKAPDPLGDCLKGEASGAEIAPLINKSIWSEHKANPVSMLGECGGDTCTLSRLCDSTKAREQFVTAVVGEIERQAAIRNGAVTYVNVGAGELFQDFEILTRAIEGSKHIKQMNIVLIDPAYKEYIEMMHENEERQPAPSDEVEFRVQNLHARLAQFTQWFAHAYPGCTMSYFIYGSLDEYIPHAGQNSDLQADIYVGSDLEKMKDTPTLPQYVRLLATAADKGESKNGHEAYLSADLSKVMKPQGVGLMLLKDRLARAPGLIHHYVKLHAQDAQVSNNTVLVNPDYPRLSGRLLTLEQSYEQSYSSWFSWIKHKLMLYTGR